MLAIFLELNSERLYEISEKPGLELGGGLLAKYQ